MTAQLDEPGYERRDLQPRGVLLSMAGLFAGIAVSAAIVAILFAFFPRPHPGQPTAAAQSPSPKGPPLEIKDGAGRAAIDAAAQGKLRGYAPVDDTHARIPIERAMQLQVQLGWPDQKTGQGAKP
jgi:hypothetical protein